VGGGIEIYHVTCGIGCNSDVVKDFSGKIHSVNLVDGSIMNAGHIEQADGNEYPEKIRFPEGRSEAGEGFRISPTPCRYSRGPVGAIFNITVYGNVLSIGAKLQVLLKVAVEGSIQRTKGVYGYRVNNG